MYRDLVIPSHDAENYVASMDQNKSRESNLSYLMMNSMAKVSMVWLKNMDDVLTEDFDGDANLRLNCFWLPSFSFFTFITLVAIEGCTSFLF